MIEELAFIFKPDGFILDHIERKTEHDSLINRFIEDKYKALYEWGFESASNTMHPSALYLHQIAEAYLNTLTSYSELEIARENTEIHLSEDTWERLSKEQPFVLGSEYISYEWVFHIFEKLHEIFQKEISHYQGSVKLYVAEKNQNLRVPERIFFHLVENKNDDDPFAFMATYATRNENGAIRHMPLRYALEEYKQDRDRLLKLLSCLNQAAKVCPLLSEFIEKGELFYPLRLNAKEAYELLKHIEDIEACGIMCRIPNWWRKKYANINLSMKIGEKEPALLGFDSLLSVRPELSVDGVPLSKEDIEQLLMESEGLAFLKGKWVEVNHQKLRELLNKMEENQESEITLMEAIRSNINDKADADNGIRISNGEWLNHFLNQLRTPDYSKKNRVPKTVHAHLRPYQKIGYNWLCQMNQYHFGACLADDMGLGKTLQVLSFLEYLRRQKKDTHILLIVPASLLGNWEKEVQRFTPEMDLHILHGKSSLLLENDFLENDHFLAITTYGMVSKLTVLNDKNWDCIILDEAQAIKNPLTKQTRAIKKLKASMRIAMTGTPIENDLSNLWSLFDFLNKGLLGSSSEFKSFANRLQQNPQDYQKLKMMISPFILRRLKTDKKIIQDLPEKMEVEDYVSLSKQQIVLYRKFIDDIEKKLMELSGMERRGMILSALTRLKQICNHPDQYLGEHEYLPKNSGKFEMLKEICETIYEKRERVLVFTQYKEIMPYLSEFLSKIFHQEGYVLNGDTPIKKRMEIVESFQKEDYVPYIVLSLRAAGTGLNLTAANHVIHFDRWWNPAVENQATDRAFRIGQRKNVVVHKLICKGTIEEKIDALIKSKVELSQNVIGSGNENWITEMDNQELMKLLRLEVNH